MEAVIEPPPALSATAQDEAFAALAARHARFLYRVAFTLLRNPQDAEDAVQETLLKLYRGNAWLAIDDEQAFLARSVWRVGLNRLASASTKAMRHAQDIADLNPASLADSPEQQAISSASRNLMRRLVHALPEHLRRTVLLSAVEGMRTRDIAGILNIPESTVRTRIHRAKAELRRLYLEATAANTLATVQEARS